MVETTDINNETKLENLYPGSIVEYRGIPHAVVSTSGEFATIRNVMDSGDIKEGVALKILLNGGYADTELYEQLDTNIKAEILDNPELAISAAELNIQELIAQMVQDVIENGVPENDNDRLISDTPSLKALSTKFVTDNKRGDMYEISGYDAKGVDLLHLKTGTTDPYSHKKFEELFTPYYKDEVDKG